jgi:hypothetical protein
MSFKNRLSLIILLATSLSCSQKQEEVSDPVKKTEHPTEMGFLVNSQGDTIPTGVPIPTKGKRIHPDSVLQPKTIELKKHQKKIL